MNDELNRAAEVIAKSRYLVVLTGAGISVESGIPAFRGSQGLWEKYDPFEYAHISSFYRDPEKVWKMLRELYKICLNAKPNPAHYALSRLEEMGILKALITQNVDGLHQRAGSKNVIEFHGSGDTLSCIDCRRTYRIEEVNIDDSLPRCSCGGVLKPNIVFFGEMIPPKALEEAIYHTKRADVFMVVGTSAQVYPAGGLPAIAKENKAVIIEVNLEPTPLTSSVTDIFLGGRAGVILPLIVDRLLNLRRAYS